MSDYKDAIQEMADLLAMEEHDTDFYSLPENLKDEIYRRASEGWMDKQYSRAEALRDAAQNR